MGIFDRAEEATHAYDLAGFRFGVPHHHLNFPDTRDEAEAKFVALGTSASYPWRKRRRAAGRRSSSATHKPTRPTWPASAMGTLRSYRAELDFLAGVAVAMKKVEARPSMTVKEEAGPPMVITLESDSGYDMYQWDW
jgi:hypothetical protein